MLEPSEIKIEPWPTVPLGGMQTGRIPSGIKITHLKTGITVTCECHRSQHRNKQSALDTLSKKLASKE